MSSILDALRRIERETGEARGLSFELPPEGGPPPSRSRWRWAGVAGALAVVGVAAATFLSRSRNGDDVGDRAAAPSEPTVVAGLEAEPAAPASVLEGNAPPAAADVAADAARGATVAPGDPTEAGQPDQPPQIGAAAEAPAAGAAVDQGERPATPAVVGAGPPVVDESPEARRAQLREQARARREAIKAQLAERRRERLTGRPQEPSEPPAQNAGAAGETASARPWQRVLAPPAEPAAGAMGDTETAPVARAPLPDAGSTENAGPGPIGPVAKLEAPPPEAIAPPLPSARAEPGAPPVEEGPAAERPIAEDEDAGPDGQLAIREGAGDGTAGTEEPSVPSADAAGQAPDTVPPDAVAEPAAPREEEILRRPPRGAPRVRVSFLLYSEDPGRRRVMLTVNDGTDLVTAYEGQRVEALEIARILPDEVHLRYEGKVFAVQPRY